MEAARCPVCGGNGLVDEGFYRQTSGQWTSAGGVETCRSCNGKGWVSLVEDCPPDDTITIPTSDAGPYWGLSGIGE